MIDGMQCIESFTLSFYHDKRREGITQADKLIRTVD
jgi:hypothetical protein